ncbi:MAG TPA: M35 family metallo-endopeptidase [Luteibacter sp.]|uniref:M35 family metallo-endopeptidase n=1 Tax=Luteibacter sp. TaxID=1886636 RepID=UPI002C680FE7|nr:M35 family metallo-endopeptidase [Luteibacter sp.]HVI54157.1 M35 family metallo-endopeptidase [Luteibacter sp.]
MRVIYRTAFTAAIWFFVTAAYAGNEVSLSLAHDGRDASAANSVALTLSNGTEHDIFIYGYNSVFAQPDGRTTSNWLSVTDAFGHEVAYKGRYVVMGAPPPSLFIRIRSGEHLDVKVDLSREYDLPPAGSVTVKTSVAIYERIPAILPNGESESIAHESVESNTATFVVARAGARIAATTSTIQCTAEQQDATSRAIAGAKSISEAAMNFLGSLYYVDPIDPENPSPPRVHMKPHRRYLNWFGSWDEGAPQAPEPGYEATDNTRVDETIVATYVRLQSGAMTACDQCKGYHPAARAWAEGKLIHLCPVNFTDPITGGITSQAGTIAHEISHQGDSMAKAAVDIDGVRDRASAHALPRSSAVRSAANYEYFITNAPLGRSSAAASGTQQPQAGH